MPITLELPEPLAGPVDTTAWPASLQPAVQGTVRYLVQTRSREDTGFWVYRPRVWAWVATDGKPGDGTLNLWTWGDVPYLKTYPCESLLGSFYNHVAGAIALAAPDREVIRTLKLCPEDGYQLLAQIYDTGQTPAHATQA